jgi:transposase
VTTSCSPALSPDLSPIEHLWDELGRRVRHCQNLPETLQELPEVLVHEWNNIPQAMAAMKYFLIIFYIEKTIDKNRII